MPKYELFFFGKHGNGVLVLYTSLMVFVGRMRKNRCRFLLRFKLFSVLSDINRFVYNFNCFVLIQTCNNCVHFTISYSEATVVYKDTVLYFL